MPEGEVLASRLVENIGESGSTLKNHHDALLSLEIDFSSIDAVGHRVVHGGEHFVNATLIDSEVIETIRSLIPLAPLHNGANLEGIIVARKAAADIPQVAVFDTAFHATMPEEAYRYALPEEIYTKHHIRRYGFHGTSHAYVSQKAAEILGEDLKDLNLITLHLGNGASACAIERGKSIDTSMGFTPLEGLVMGSRSGDVDPAILLYMQRELGMSVEEVDRVLNKESGLLGLCSQNDLRTIVGTSTPESDLAFKVMVRRIQKYIGAYMALLGDVDAVVFTGGIGENSVEVRDAVLHSKMFQDLKCLVVKTDEELAIAREVMNLL